MGLSFFLWGRWLALINLWDLLGVYRKQRNLWNWGWEFNWCLVFEILFCQLLYGKSILFPLPFGFPCIISLLLPFSSLQWPSFLHCILQLFSCFLLTSALFLFFFFSPAILCCHALVDVVSSVCCDCFALCKCGLLLF